MNYAETVFETAFLWRAQERIKQHLKGIEMTTLIYKNRVLKAEPGVVLDAAITMLEMSGLHLQASMLRVAPEQVFEQKEETRGKRCLIRRCASNTEFKLGNKLVFVPNAMIDAHGVAAALTLWAERHGGNAKYVEVLRDIYLACSADAKDAKEVTG